MPLPFAPPPKDSKVYDDLSQTKLTAVTGSQLISLKENLYTQGQDGAEDEMRRLKLLQETALNLVSADAIPNNFHIHTMNGVNNVVSWVDFASLGGTNNGIWVVQDIIASYTGGSGNVYFQMRASDGTSDLEWYMGVTTSSTYFNSNLDSQWDEIGSKRWGGGRSAGNLDLGVKPSGTFDADSMTIYVICYRIR